jgi:hypothetical protein
MKLPNERTKNWMRIGLIGCALLMIYTNCAPSNHDNKAVDTGAASLNSANALATTSNSENVLQNMASVTGLSVTTVNKDLLDFFFGPGFSNNNVSATGAKARISASGKATSVNAPMWMSITNLAGEFCSALVAKERVVGAPRVFFNQIDFTKKMSEQSAEAVGDSIGRMARAFWARNETLVEKNLLITSMNDEFTTKAVADTELVNLSKGMIYGCTVMLSSLDAQR